MTRTLVLSHLETLKSLRGQPQADAGLAQRIAELKEWQHDRLTRTYADLVAHPRYGRAATFFLEDLYGAKDFSRRDAEMIRIYPTLVRVLPHATVETVDLALELDALAEQFDQDMARALAGPAAITETAYAAAFREVGRRPQRERQVELVAEAGRRLDQVVKKPLVATALRMLRKPAHLAGLGDLQTFLEHGFEAFRAMGGADEFLAIIITRETEIMQRIFANHPQPFAVC
ncbi:MAG: hypothetical protein JNM76_13455 [Betaproteobacteria bacterium]|nr:hypothetical protein [Betaproteobacteria bacterium]